MKNKVRIMRLSIWVAGLAMIFGLSNANGQESNSIQHQPSEGLELSEKEQKEVLTFLDKMKAAGTSDLNGFYKAAQKGDRVAMWVVGQCYLSGRAGVINQEAANRFFKMSGSLGYAPALYDISQMYVSQNKDPLLSFVYLNLAISFGHTEYRDYYYQKIELLAELVGQPVIREIERIALEKTVKISEIQKELQDQTDENMKIKELMFNDITSCDLVYNENYWKQFFKSEEAWELFFHSSKELKEKSSAN